MNTSNIANTHSLRRQKEYPANKSNTHQPMQLFAVNKDDKKIRVSSVEIRTSTKYLIFSAVLNKINQLIKFISIGTINTNNYLMNTKLTHSAITREVKHAEKEVFTPNHLSNLDENDKQSLANEITNLLKNNQDYFAGIGCNNFDSLIIILSMLSGAENANLIRNQLQKNTFNPQKVISKNFSERYLKLIRTDHEVRSAIIKNLKLYQAELAKKITVPEKLKYINSLPKEIRELLGYHSKSTINAGEKVHILTERINLICDTMVSNTDISDSPYNNFFQWDQWISGHVGCRIIDDQKEQYFALLPAQDKYGKFEKISATVINNFGIDEEAQEHNSFIRCTIPIGGSIINNTQQQHQYFGLDKFGLADGKTTLETNNHYQYFSEHNNCVGAAHYIEKCGQSALFTQTKLSHRMTNITDPVYSMARLYEMTCNIKNINSKCTELEKRFKYASRENQHYNTSFILFCQCNDNSKIQKFIEEYKIAKITGDRSNQLSLLKQMVEEIYNHIADNTFYINHRDIVVNLLDEIKVVYANRSEEQISKEDYNTCNQHAQKLKNTENPQAVAKQLKEKFPNTPPQVLEIIIVGLYANNRDSLKKALNHIHPQENGISSKIINLVYPNKNKYEILAIINSLPNLKDFSSNDPDKVNKLKSSIDKFKEFFPDNKPAQLVCELIKFCPDHNKLYILIKLLYKDDNNSLGIALNTLFLNNPETLTHILATELDKEDHSQAIDIIKHLYENNNSSLKVAINTLFQFDPQELINILMNHPEKNQIQDAIPGNQDAILAIISGLPNIKDFSLNDPDKINKLKSSIDEFKEFFPDNKPEQLVCELIKFCPDHNKLYILIKLLYKDDNNSLGIALNTLFLNNPETLTHILATELDKEDHSQAIDIIKHLYENNNSSLKVAINTLFQFDLEGFVNILRNNFALITKYLSSSNPDMLIDGFKKLYNDDLTKTIDTINELYYDYPKILGKMLKKVYNENTITKLIDTIKNIYSENSASSNINEAIIVAFCSFCYEMDDTKFAGLVDTHFPNQYRLFISRRAIQQRERGE